MRRRSACDGSELRGAAAGRGRGGRGLAGGGRGGGGAAGRRRRGGGARCAAGGPRRRRRPASPRRDRRGGWSREDDAREALYLGSSSVVCGAAVAALREERLALVEGGDGVGELRLAEDGLDCRGALLPRGGEQREVDEQQLLLELAPPRWRSASCRSRAGRTASAQGPRLRQLGRQVGAPRVLEQRLVRREHADEARRHVLGQHHVGELDRRRVAARARACVFVCVCGGGGRSRRSTRARPRAGGRAEMGRGRGGGGRHRLADSVTMPDSPSRPTRRSRTRRSMTTSS